MYAKYCSVPKEEITVCPSVGWIADFADPQTVLNITFNGTTITQTGQRQLESDEQSERSTRRWRRRKPSSASRRARRAWAKIDTELVEDAAAIPFDWDKQANIEAANVHGVGQLWNIGTWDYSWTSLK